MSASNMLGWWLAPPRHQGGQRATRFCESTDFGAVSRLISSNVLPLVGRELIAPAFFKASLCVSIPGRVVHIAAIAPARLGLQLEADTNYWPAIADCLDDLAKQRSVDGAPVIAGFVRKSAGVEKRSVDVQLRSPDGWMSFSVSQAIPLGALRFALVPGRLADLQSAN